MNVVQNNLISIVILFILFLGIYKQVNHKDPIFRSFLILLGINAMMLILEVVIYLLVGTGGSFVYVMIVAATILYHTSIPVMLFITFLFYDFHFNVISQRTIKFFIAFIVIFIVNLVFVILSLSNGYIYQISGSNLYEPGLYYVYYELVIYLVFVSIFMYSVTQRMKIDHSTFIPLSLFIIPLTVTIILTVFAGFVYVTWNAFMISMLIIYIFMQLQITSTDYLTGLQNRRGYEYLLFNLNKSKVQNETIIGIMMDIDNFKTINDEFGHHVGDEALKAFGIMLKKAVRKNDFVSRTGGDEFAIVIQSNEPNVDQIVIDRINKQLKAFNNEMPFGFKLHVSIGSDTYDEEKHQSISSFFAYLDKEMYKDKRESERIRI